PAGTLIDTDVPAGSEPAASTAARSVHRPALSAHLPLPGWASCESAVLFTTKVTVAAATGAAPSGVGHGSIHPPRTKAVRARPKRVSNDAAVRIGSSRQLSAHMRVARPDRFAKGAIHANGHRAQPSRAAMTWSSGLAGVSGRDGATGTASAP